MLDQIKILRSKARVEGEKAYISGKPITSCKYREGILREEWMSGYEDCKIIYERANRKPDYDYEEQNY